MKSRSETNRKIAAEAALLCKKQFDAITEKNRAAVPPGAPLTPEPEVTMPEWQKLELIRRNMAEWHRRMNPTVKIPPRRGVVFD